MTKRFWHSSFVIFVLAMATDWLLRGVILHGDYAKLTTLLMRTEADSQHYFGWMILAHLLIAGAFVWICQRGKDENPFLSQGLRFGLVVALPMVWSPTTSSTSSSCSPCQACSWPSRSGSMWCAC